jgi:hypothetical protein
VILLFDRVSAVLEGLWIICRVKDENKLLNRMVRVIIEPLFIHAGEVIRALQDINCLKWISLCGTDEVNESDRLIDEFMICKHGLLKELSLPFEKPRCQSLILVIIKKGGKFSLQLLYERILLERLMTYHICFLLN